MENGYLDDTKRQNFFRRHYGAPIVAISDDDVDPILFTYIPGNLARRHHLVPVKLDKDGLVVAMEDPSDLALLDSLKEVAGLRIKPVVASSTDILECLAGYPEEKPKEVKQLRATEFDPATRLLSVLFWPIMSFALLGGIVLAILKHPGFRKWLQDLIGFSEGAPMSSQYFNLSLYFFLSWGIWTLIMFELAGLVFDDLAWKEPADLGGRKSKSKATMYSIFLGFLGADRFYLGYKGMGILKALTLGLFGIWWVFDAVLMLGGRIPDAAGQPLE